WFHESLYVVFVDERGAGVDKSWHGRKAVFGPICIERFELVVVEVIQHSETDKAHGVGLLANGGGDHALLYPVERIRIGIHCHNDLVFDIVVAQHSSDFLASQGLQTNKGIHLVLFLAEDLRGRVKGDTRVTFDVEDRKSTRLNSSHVAISYAVFCLKKKII